MCFFCSNFEYTPVKLISSVVCVSFLFTNIFNTDLVQVNLYNTKGDNLYQCTYESKHIGDHFYTLV